MNNVGKSFLTGFLESSSKELKVAEEREYEQLSSARTRREAAHAATYKMNKANAARQAEFFAYAKEGGVVNQRKLATALMPKDMPTNQQEAFMQDQYALWEKDPQALIRSVRSKYPIDPTADDYDSSQSVDSDHFEAKRRAFDGWGLANVLGLKPSTSRLSQAVKTAKNEDTERMRDMPVGDLGVIERLSKRDKPVSTKLYRNTETGQVVESIREGDSTKLMIPGADGSQPVTDKWAVIDKAAGATGGKPRAGRVLNKTELKIVGSSIKKKIAEGNMSLEASQEQEAIKASSQLVKDLSNRGMDVTEAQAMVEEMFSDERYEIDDWGFNSFDIKAFREDAMAEIDRLVGSGKLTSPIPVMTPEEVQAAESGTKFRTTDGRTLVKP